MRPFSNAFASRLLGYLTILAAGGACACWAQPAAPAPPATTVVHHDLSVVLEIASHALEVTDTLEFSPTLAMDDQGGYRFLLHQGLAPRVESEGWSIEPIEGPIEGSFFGINATTETVAENVPLEGFRLRPPSPSARRAVLRYGGKIHHPLSMMGEEYQRSFSETPGLIDEQGVFLSGTSFWVPSFGDGMMEFRLEVKGLTPPWDVVSQGGRTAHELSPEGRRRTVWECPHPTEEVYLVAGPWTEYSENSGNTEIFAFLRTPDPALANKYLQATERYLKMYEQMLPPYPYPSFSLVENFWETGYGMPGFTLLGPKIIRFPWILASSYPHEILHNWWGNSVYVDPVEGNWCEGLTAYMADHLLAEQRGEGAVYRRATLKKFTDMVKGGEDIPLTQFRSRHSAASEAVGYGKSMMLFHMVRQITGDPDFIESLRAFARRMSFKRASLSHIAGEFTLHTGILWKPFFLHWATATGAPRLEIAALSVSPGEDAGHPFTLHLTLRQSQKEDPFPFSVPVAVTLEGQGEALVVSQEMAGRETTLEIPCSSRPLRVDVDPAFDVMRRLDPMEVPPALTTLFGEKDPLFVIPEKASPGEQEAWRKLAAAWKGKGAPRLVTDAEIDAIDGGPVWLLGWNNRFGPALAGRLTDQQVALDENVVTIGEENIPRKDHSTVLVARSEGNPEQAVAWVTADPVEAIAGLSRKLPHYTKYSYLGFRGDEPQNMAKGMWVPLSSPLVRVLDTASSPALRLPARKPLTELPPAFDGARMKRTVAHLASAEMEGRGLGSSGLERATAWVESRFREIGLVPAGEQGFRQSWSFEGGQPPRMMTLTNLIGRIEGSDPGLRDRPVMVLAHLDHLGRGWPDVRAGNAGRIHFGADDNASGVAALLELARAMAAGPAPARPVLFAVVTGEEAGRIGSKHLLASNEKSRPFACVNLDTVGRLGEGKLMVLNADTAREWRFIFMGVGYTTGVPLAIVKEPLHSSDQISCIEAGVPAVQLFSGPNQDYHRPSDTAEKIDGAGMARIVEAASEVVSYLADRKEPLTVTIPGAKTQGAPGGHPGAAERPKTGRRVSLGTMPDFSFEGPGVRVQQVMPDSPAAQAGIQAGDVILALGGEKVSDLRSYSAALKKHAPGDQVTITLERDGKTLELKATLKAR